AIPTPMVGGDCDDDSRNTEGDRELGGDHSLESGNEANVPSPSNSRSSTLRRISAGSASEALPRARDIVFTASAKPAQQRVPQQQSTQHQPGAVSPRSMPRAITMPSGSSVSSSQSVASVLLPTPMSSPMAQVTTNALSILSVSETAAPHQMPSGSPTPQGTTSEASRMLKLVMESADSANTRSPGNSRPGSQTMSPERVRQSMAMLSRQNSRDSGADSKRSSTGGRERASSVTHNLISMIETGDSSIEEHVQVRPRNTLMDDIPERDSPGSVLVKSNSERMSTWSSSSGRTLSDSLSHPRVPVLEDPLMPGSMLNSAKHALASVGVSPALCTLTASAAMVNSRPSSSHSRGDRTPGSAGSDHSGSGRNAGRVRPTDLGLNIRSDLERRVRSFSESETNPLGMNDERPHSSIGVYGTV
ncbi:hypothetical protein EC988_007209, partial [Linderina pennispora]